MKKKIILLLMVSIGAVFFSCKSSKETEARISQTYLNTSLSITERVNDLLSQMTLQQKAAQMVQAEQSTVTKKNMQDYCYGSVLSGGGSIPNNINTLSNWSSFIDNLQNGCLSSNVPIPFLYGIDAVHGHGNVKGAVIFPHNIGVGAANDKDLTYKMGVAVANEMKLTKTLWAFGPCIAVSLDPRWGRTYESYSSDTSIVTSLATEFAKGLLDNGVMPTAKHYIGDGATTYGTGENNQLVDRGDARMTEAQLREKYLPPYKALIDAGVKTVMPSYSSFNGVKMHANKYLITDVLKGELGFDGFVISDWEAINSLGGKNLSENVIIATNAGIDMFMQPYNAAQVITSIIDAVENNKISNERVNDAVTRILRVKMEMGLFEDPMQKSTNSNVTELGTDEYRKLAKQIVEKSLVLVKNEKKVLPIQKGTKIFLTGPAIDNVGVQCGGWTITWQGKQDVNGTKITQGTTILEGFKQYANEYGLEIITDKEKASQADVVILCIGEKPYAEFEGDTRDLSITGDQSLKGNQEAIELAKSLNKPTVALIVAGRNVLINDYINDWDSVVMCYLPGSEGDGVAAVILNKTPISGKLPMPWYKSLKNIATDNAEIQFNLGYGLQY
jgi:beta-glucosidase